MKTEIPIIGPERKFYGYVIGVSLERSKDPLGGDAPQRMFVRFEYNGATSVYQVPDISLFENLTHRMLRNAQMRAEYGDYGYEKVFIEKDAEGWIVDLP